MTGGGLTTPAARSCPPPAPRQTGQTALHTSAEKGTTEVMELLIETHADINLADKARSHPSL